MLNKYKNLIIAVLVIIGGFYGYNQFFNTNSTKSASLQVTNSADVLGADIIKAINQINALKLDRSVFDDPIFKTLVDRSEEIQPQAKSRPNPFAPITDIDFTVSTSSSSSGSVNFDSDLGGTEEEESAVENVDIPSTL